MPISITSHRDPEPLDLAAFERLAEFVLDREDVPPAAELSLAVVGEEEMAALNERYRMVEGATDVLAFPCDDPCPVPGDEPVTLGDVVIAPEVAERQAAELGHTVEEELNLLLVHGILHLLGYDHETDDDARVMQERQDSLLAAYAEGL
ncbi:MAG TPA: rRNA maturation RNase YbeY [Coriobacteriia bacterium]|nr:rRNA maturation RNase YbeY [Coriobacteriia bacterium]